MRKQSSDVSPKEFHEEVGAPRVVIPVQTGIQEKQLFLDARVRGHDGGINSDLFGKLLVH